MSHPGSCVAQSIDKHNPRYHAIQHTQVRESGDELERRHQKIQKFTSPSPWARRLAETWLPLIAWMALIFFVSGLRGPQTKALADVFTANFEARAFAYHVAVFAVLGLLIYRVVAVHLARSTILIVSISLLFGFGYAVSDELHQALVQGRISSALDVAYDALGLFLAVILTSLVHYILIKRGQAIPNSSDSKLLRSQRE